MTGIILAGGESSRMGKDKAFLMFGGRPLFEHVVNTLRPIFRDVIVVTNTPEAYCKYGVTVTTDAVEKRGPLTGIYSGLLVSKSEYNFVVACDMPFLNSGLIEYMNRQCEGYDIVVPEINGQVEPLHAIYHRRLIPRIEAALKNEERQIRKLFEKAEIRRIISQELDLFDPGRRSFTNLNTPNEYREAACLDLECRS